MKHCISVITHILLPPHYIFRTKGIYISSIKAMYHKSETITVKLTQCVLAIGGVITGAVKGFGAVATSKINDTNRATITSATAPEGGGSFCSWCGI